MEIPCIYIPYESSPTTISNTTFLYFHGNAEDLGFSFDFLSNLNKELKVIEYYH